MFNRTSRDLLMVKIKFRLLEPLPQTINLSISEVERRQNGSDPIRFAIGFRSGVPVVLSLALKTLDRRK
jgi:hypothetical protein